LWCVFGAAINPVHSGVMLIIGDKVETIRNGDAGLVCFWDYGIGWQDYHVVIWD